MAGQLPSSLFPPDPGTGAAIGRMHRGSASTWGWFRSHDWHSLHGFAPCGNVKRKPKVEWRRPKQAFQEFYKRSDVSRQWLAGAEEDETLDPVGSGGSAINAPVDCRAPREALPARGASLQRTELLERACCIRPQVLY